MHPRLTTLATIAAEARAAGLSNLTHLRALLLLGEGPQIMGVVSSTIGVSTAAITGVGDVLEKSGLAQRQNHPTDRRAFHLALTEKGRACLEKWAALGEKGGAQ